MSRAAVVAVARNAELALNSRNSAQRVSAVALRQQCDGYPRSGRRSTRQANSTSGDSIKASIRSLDLRARADMATLTVRTSFVRRPLNAPQASALHSHISTSTHRRSAGASRACGCSSRSTKSPRTARGAWTLSIPLWARLSARQRSCLPQLSADGCRTAMSRSFAMARTYIRAICRST